MNEASVPKRGDDRLKKIQFNYPKIYEETQPMIGQIYKYFAFHSENMKDICAAVKESVIKLRNV